MSRYSHIIRKIILDLALVDLGWKYKNKKGTWSYVGENKDKIPKYAKDSAIKTREKKEKTDPKPSVKKERTTKLKMLAKKVWAAFFYKINEDNINETHGFLYEIATKQNSRAHEDHLIMTPIADKLGYHGAPQRISREEFERMDKDPNIMTVRRGVGGASVSGFLAGENKIQRVGMYGSGCYSALCTVEDKIDPTCIGMGQTDEEYEKRLNKIMYGIQEVLYDISTPIIQKRTIPYFIRECDTFEKHLKQYKKEGKTFDEAYNLMYETYHSKFHDDWDLSDELTGGLTKGFSKYFMAHSGRGTHGDMGWEPDDMKALYATEPDAEKAQRALSFRYDSIGTRDARKQKYGELSDEERYKNFGKNLAEFNKQFKKKLEYYNEEDPRLDLALAPFKKVLPKETMAAIQTAIDNHLDYVGKSKEEKIKIADSFVAYSTQIWNALPKIKQKNYKEAIEVAEDYVAAAKKEGKEGVMMEMAIDPSAKIGDYDELKKIELDPKDYGVTDEADQKAFIIMVERDPGLKAMLLGYDGIRIWGLNTTAKASDYLLLFNRSKAMIPE